MSRLDRITVAQLDLIRALAAQLDIPLGLVKDEADARFGMALECINRGEASELIEWFKLIKEGHAARPVPKEQMALFSEEGRR